MIPSFLLSVTEEAVTTRQFTQASMSEGLFTTPDALSPTAVLKLEERRIVFNQQSRKHRHIHFDSPNALNGTFNNVTQAGGYFQQGGTNDFHINGTLTVSGGTLGNNDTIA